MSQKNLIVTHDGIKKRLKDYTPEKAISEYIENSIDAGAKNININYIYDDVGYVPQIDIIDDGIGFSKKDLITTFDVFLFSRKKRSVHHSNVFGKDGIGRLTFFSFASLSTRESSQKDSFIKLSISSRDLSKYEILEDNNLNNGNIGTKISFESLKVTRFFLENELENYLIRRFAWIFILKNITININGNPLDFKSYIVSSQESLIKVDEIDFHIKFIKWADKLIEEESKNYFIKSNGEEIIKTGTSLNRQSDGFYHSVFIQSIFFDVQQLNANGDAVYFDNDEIGKKNREIYHELIRGLDKQLNEFRRPFIENLAENYVEENIGSHENESLIENLKNNIIKDTVKELYLVQPKLFTQLGEDQKNIFIKLIATILEEGNSNKLFDIINSVLDLSPKERERFGNLLKHITLSNIIKTIEKIGERLVSIELLHRLIFDKTLGAGENPDLQQVIASNYWIFGEEYHMIVGTGEVKFQNALRNLLGFYTGQTQEKQIIKHQNKNKEIDILLAQQERLTNKTKNIVIELKHPNKTLGRDEYNQVMGYFDLIYNTNGFNGNEFERKFYLVGNGINDQIRTLYTTNRNHGEYVIHRDTDNGKNYTVYCYKWEDILEKNRQRLEYLKQELELSLDEHQQDIDAIDKKEGIKDLLKSST